MINIEVDNRIKEVCPLMKIGLLRATVRNEATCNELWEELEAAGSEIRARYELLEINRRPAIAATRNLYKKLGKDPNRYRGASEALCRRVVKGLGLYRLTTLVDVVNLVSLKSGYAISGLDADLLVGDTLKLGVGENDEIYHGIGRGLLNIEGLPVYRDAQGGVATPTSDEERTKFSLETTHVQININAFGPEMPMTQAMDMTITLLEKYAQATDIETQILTQF